MSKCKSIIQLTLQIAFHVFLHVFPPRAKNSSLMVAEQAQNYIIQLIILKLQKTTFPKKRKKKTESSNLL